MEDVSRIQRHPDVQGRTSGMAFRTSATSNLLGGSLLPIVRRSGRISSPRHFGLSDRWAHRQVDDPTQPLATQRDQLLRRTDPHRLKDARNHLGSSLQDSDSDELASWQPTASAAHGDWPGAFDFACSILAPAQQAPAGRKPRPDMFRQPRKNSSS